VALTSIEWRIIQDYLNRIVNAIDNSSPGSFQTVDYGTFDHWRKGAKDYK
jgi:hypothetical protein